ncbi:MAG: ferritin-like domain-containing protein [Ignavibacteria bacterium]|jgi:ferritin-like metal-binding protein YciE|nr:ferritin-like domain-containing protein [Ignavibacteria bacterium]MCU7503584.1 ferritin-like domain-containing protein [Ignavibacteria bacterium]MCU7516762.1 ferritin-like domain-containing protein [Ignavibacteria bacterium]
MQVDSLKKLYLDELRDLVSSESQIINAMPKMIQAASSKELKNAFNEHLDVTKRQLDRLKEIFRNMNESPEGKSCAGMEGIIREGQEIIGQATNSEVKDAGLIAAAQRIEHYEIAVYGVVRTYAEILGDEDSRDLLQNTLDEEKETDKKLTELAVNSINVEARK